MDTSFFLAKIFGIFFLVLGLSLLAKYDTLRNVIKDFAGTTPISYITGTFVLVIGLILVSVHNIWESNWRVVITIISWLTLFKGISFLLFPDDIIISLVSLVNRKGVLVGGGIVVILLGFYLAYKGFSLS